MKKLYIAIAVLILAAVGCSWFGISKPEAERVIVAFESKLAFWQALAMNLAEYPKAWSSSIRMIRLSLRGRSNSTYLKSSSNTIKS